MAEVRQRCLQDLCSEREVTGLFHLVGRDACHLLSAILFVLQKRPGKHYRLGGLRRPVDWPLACTCALDQLHCTCFRSLATTQAGDLFIAEIPRLSQWSLQNRAHRAHGPVGVEPGPVGKLTTGHKCARLEFWVAHPEISGCPPHTAHFSSNFPASYFPAVFTCVPAALIYSVVALDRVGHWATLPESSRASRSSTHLASRARKSMKSLCSFRMRSTSTTFRCEKEVLTRGKLDALESG